MKRKITILFLVLCVGLVIYITLPTNISVQLTDDGVPVKSDIYLLTFTPKEDSISMVTDLKADQNGYVNVVTNEKVIYLRCNDVVAPIKVNIFKKNYNEQIEMNKLRRTNSWKCYFRSG